VSTITAKIERSSETRVLNIYFFSRKYSTRIQEQEEHIETLLVKINNLEKQKSRLQSEVEVLIIDLEKVCSFFTCCTTVLAIPIT